MRKPENAHPLSARIMKIKWAARMRKIPVDELMQELNASVH